MWGQLAWVCKTKRIVTSGTLLINKEDFTGSSVTLLRGRGAYEDFSIIYFYLIYLSVPFFAAVVLPCFKIKSVTVIGTFYTDAVPRASGVVFCVGIGRRWRATASKIKKGDEFAVGFDAFSFL